MARLPEPGKDSGAWGEILNDYLLQSLKTDGTIQNNAVTSAALAPNSVTNTALASNAVNATIIADGSITETLLDSSLQAKINTPSAVSSVNSQVGDVILDADDINDTGSSHKFISQSDIARLSNTSGINTGDQDLTSLVPNTRMINGKSLGADVMLSKADVGLSNVDNTSDSTKNSATVTLTNKTLNNPTVSAYTESVIAIGTVTTAYTLSIVSGTILTATLSASMGCTFTMPTPAAGKSFNLMLRQAATTGNGTAAFTGVKWAAGGMPTMTAAAGKMDIYSFFSDGVNWYGQYSQGYAP